MKPISQTAMAETYGIPIGRPPTTIEIAGLPYPPGLNRIGSLFHRVENCVAPNCTEQSKNCSTFLKPSSRNRTGLRHLHCGCGEAEVSEGFRLGVPPATTSPSSSAKRCAYTRETREYTPYEGNGRKEVGGAWGRSLRPFRHTTKRKPSEA